jgi:hypothetical protein
LISDFPTCSGIKTARKTNAKNQKPATGHAKCGFQEAWTAAYYRRKRTEGKTHSIAVRALANIWVRVIHAMRRQHRSYLAATFRAAQQAHARQAA